MLLLDIIKYICLKQGTQIEERDITILVNSDSQINIQNILLLSKTVKSIDIVTSNINKFLNLQKQILENVGMMIKVSNNKKKSLNKSNVIINIDFDEEEIKKYILPKDGIIINVNNKNIEYKKQFSGIVINYIESKFNENDLKFFNEFNLYDAFEKTVLFESVFYENTNFQHMREKIEKQKTIVKNVFGNNGMIDDSEFIRKNA